MIYHGDFHKDTINAKPFYQLAIVRVFRIRFFAIFNFDKILKSYAAIKIGERHSSY